MLLRNATQVLVCPKPCGVRLRGLATAPARLALARR